MTQERRKDERFTINTPAVLAQEDVERRLHDVICRDIGRGGVALISQSIIPRGSKCTLRIHISSSKPTETDAEVVWQSKKPKAMGNFSGYLTGLQFLQSPSNGNNSNELMGLLNSIGISVSKKVDNATRWRFPNSKFIYEKRIYLKHTNMEGNTYYDNYIGWQGEAREALLLSHPDVQEFLKPENFVKMITHSVQQRYIRDSYFGDVVRIEVTSREIKQCSFILVFRYYKNGSSELISEGWQKICFADLKTGKICRIPKIILDLIEPISEQMCSA